MSVFIEGVLFWMRCCDCSELLPVSLDDDKLSLRVRGLVTNANYSNKKLTFLLFINRKSMHTIQCEYI